MEIEISRMERIEYRVLFSATYFEAFYFRAIKHVARSINKPFNFIESTRLYNKIYNDYKDHVGTFMTIGINLFFSYCSLTSFIASSILIDAYPPRIYSKDPGSTRKLAYGLQNFPLGRCSKPCIRNTVSRL